MIKKVNLSLKYGYDQDYKKKKCQKNPEATAA